MKVFFKFLKLIPNFFKFYKDYSYSGDDMKFIIENYEEVLCNRTKFMSKPSYYAADIIEQLDNYYKECKEEYKKNCCLDDVIELLEIIKKNNPNKEIIVESKNGSASTKLGSSVIYIGINEELVFDGE